MEYYGPSFYHTTPSIRFQFAGGESEGQREEGKRAFPLVLVGGCEADRRAARPRPLSSCAAGGVGVKNARTCLRALRGGGQRTMQMQPWITEGLPPEDNPAGKIWETASWRERILRHKEQKAAQKLTEHDAYGPIDYVSARARLGVSMSRCR